MYNVPAPRTGSKNSVLRTTRTDALHAGFTLPDATPYRLWQVMSISNRMFRLQKMAVWIVCTVPNGSAALADQSAAFDVFPANPGVPERVCPKKHGQNP